MKKLVVVVVSLALFAHWLAAQEITVNQNHAIAQYNNQLTVNL